MKRSTLFAIAVGLYIISAILDAAAHNIGMLVPQLAVGGIWGISWRAQRRHEQANTESGAAE